MHKTRTVSCWQVHDCPAHTGLTFNTFFPGKEIDLKMVNLYGIWSLHIYYHVQLF
jgi:hypothetical protein